MSQQQSTFRKKKRKNNFTKRNISHVRAIVFKKEKKREEFFSCKNETSTKSG